MELGVALGIKLGWSLEPRPKYANIATVSGAFMTASNQFATFSVPVVVIQRVLTLNA